MKKQILLLWAVLSLSFLALGHEIRPAYLEIQEDSAHRVRVFWKQPVQGDVGVKLVPHLSAGWLEASPNVVSASHSFYIKQWQGLDATQHPLQGQTISVEGLDATITNVLVVVQLANGTNLQRILTPKDPAYTISGNAQTLPVLDYTVLGIEHILTGIDHLLFVLGLILLVDSRKVLIQTITSFTLAHSITLSAAAMGWVHLQPAVVESVIALSVVFLGVELVHKVQGRHGLTIQYPWVIAFTFGLLHGFGFAGALLDIGLPQDNIPVALLLFNVGVEIGQLLFVALILFIIWLFHRIPISKPAWTGLFVPYAIGSFAAFWCIERLVIVFD